MTDLTFKEQLQQVCDEAKDKPNFPSTDGKYLLPDRRVLIKEGDRFILIGHRDKKKQRIVGRLSEEKLRGLLVLPCYGGHKSDKLAQLNHSELTRLFYPRPKQFFWIYSKLFKYIVLPFYACNSFLNICENGSL